MVKIPETHTPSSISLGRNTPDSLDAAGSKINNPFADAIDTLGAGLNMFGKTLDREQKVKAAEDEKQRVAKLKAAEDAQKEIRSSQLKEYQARLSMLMSDLRANNDGRELDPNQVVLLGSRCLEQAFDAKQYKAFGISAPLPQELMEKAKGITFDTVRSNYETVQRSNVALIAKQTAERNKLASETFVRQFASGETPLTEIGAAANAMGIAYREANMPDEQIAMNINNLILSSVKGWAVNNANDLSGMKGLLQGYMLFPDMLTGEQRTFNEMVSDKDFEAAKKAYQSNLENKLAQDALNSPEVDIRKMLCVDGMYDNQSELDAANKRVLENKTALQVQRQQILDEQNREGFTAAILDENHGSMYAQQVAIDRANAEKANNLQTASEEKWKKELKDIPWYDFSGKKKERLNDALFNSEKQKGEAELFSQTVIWNGEPFDYLRIINSDGFKKAGGSQKFLLEDMRLKAKYDRAKQMLLPAGIDVEDLIDKAVKSLDPKGLYGKDYLQPDIRWELATTLSGVAPNKQDIKNLINQTAAKVYGRTVFKDEKQKTDYDSLVEIIRTATANKKTNQTKDDVFMSIRNELNDKYDSDIVDKMMPYIISGQYVKAIGVVNAFESR